MLSICGYLRGAMFKEIDSKRSKPVAIWLLAGVFMIIVQIILGGITRLTESGLSITELALSAKSDIEKIREQSLNLE